MIRAGPPSGAGFALPPWTRAQAVLTLLRVLALPLVLTLQPAAASMPVAATAPAAPALVRPLLERPWVEYRTPGFSLYSDLDEAQALASVRDIERFAIVVRDAVGLGQRVSPIPVEFWLCSDASTVVRLAGDATLLGFMRPSPRASYLVATASALADPGGSPMLHEYVHLLVRSAGVRGTAVVDTGVVEAGASVLDRTHAEDAVLDLPRWYDEGLAEFLATLRVRDGEVRIGVPNRRRLEQLRMRDPLFMNIGQVLAVTDVGALPSFRVAEFYALSWVLVHWAHARDWAARGARPGDSAGTEPMLQSAAIDDYLRRVSAGEPVRAAARAAFGSDLRSVNERLFAHADRLRPAPILRLPVARFAGLDVEPRVTRRVLDGYEAAWRLGYVALGGGQRHGADGDEETARALFGHALQLRPFDLRAEMGLAVADQFEARFAEGVARARRIHAAAPDDTLLAQELADMLYEWCDSDAPPADCEVLHEEAIRLYEGILRVAPARIETHAALGGALLHARADPARARLHLRRAHAAMPFSAVLVLQLGVAELRLGNMAVAERLLRRAERWSESARMGRRVRTALIELGCRGGAAAPTTC